MRYQIKAIMMSTITKNTILVVDDKEPIFPKAS
jgi:hypothetical protein